MLLFTVSIKTEDKRIFYTFVQNIEREILTNIQNAFL